MSQKTTDFTARILGHLDSLYPADDNQDAAEVIAAEALRIREQIKAASSQRYSEQDILLITYGDSIRHPDAHPLASLDAFLTTHVREAVGIIHILPFFPYSSDDGFSVIDYEAVDPEIGTWEDIHRLSEHFDLMFDFVINHVSRESAWFLDFLTDRPPHRDFFIEMDARTDTALVIRPRNTPLLTKVETTRGPKHVWATFSEDQIDLDFSNIDVLRTMVRIFLMYLELGARYIRLDAIAFLWKQPGTTCLHLPQTHEVVQLLRLLLDEVRPDGVLLTETNVPNEENLSYFGDGNEAHMVYQFSLAPLLLHALLRGTSSFLATWLRTIEDVPHGCTFLNFTASHDGIGLRPAEGILPEQEIEDLITLVRQHGGHISMRTGNDGVDRPYEMNITYFDALGETFRGADHWHVERFLISQLIPLSLKGVPAIYIHSLTATPNDNEGVGRTGRVRSINRRKWQVDALIGLLNDPRSTTARVFFELTRLMRARRRQPAFHPDAPQHIMSLSPEVLGVLRGDFRNDWVICLYNLTGSAHHVSLDGVAEVVGTDVYDLVGKELVTLTEQIQLRPYQALWLKAA